MCEYVDEFKHNNGKLCNTTFFLEKTVSLACLEGSEFNGIFHLKAQLDIRFRSSLSISESLSLSFKTENIDVSSANIFILDWIPSGIFLIKIRKNSGPNIKPWGAPANTSTPANTSKKS